MNRQQLRELKRLDEKISKAKTNNDIMRLSRLMAEREKLLSADKKELKMTLKDAMVDYSVEDRREMTVDIVCAVAIADMLWGVTLELNDKFKKKLNLKDTPILTELQEICDRLKRLVKTIDNVNNEVFSTRYMEIVDEIETELNADYKESVFKKFYKTAGLKERL